MPFHYGKYMKSATKQTIHNLKAFIDCKKHTHTIPLSFFYRSKPTWTSADAITLYFYRIFNQYFKMNSNWIDYTVIYLAIVFGQKYRLQRYKCFIFAQVLGSSFLFYGDNTFEMTHITTEINEVDHKNEIKASNKYKYRKRGEKETGIKMKFFIVFETITIYFLSAAFPVPLKIDIDFFLLSNIFWWSVFSDKIRVTQTATKILRPPRPKMPLIKEWQFLWYNHIARYHAESLRWRKELKVSAAPILNDL